MAKRKVDEAFEAMASAAYQWSQAARKILRYGNLADMERLEEEAQHMLFVLEERGKERNSEGVNRRLRREVDSVVADAVATGRWPARDGEEGGDPRTLDEEE